LTVDQWRQLKRNVYGVDDALEDARSTGAPTTAPKQGAQALDGSLARLSLKEGGWIGPPAQKGSQQAHAIEWTVPTEARSAGAAEFSSSSPNKQRCSWNESEVLVCQLSRMRRVTVHVYRGITLVSIREFYEKDGELLPGKKGISLTAGQWREVSTMVPYLYIV